MLGDTEWNIFFLGIKCVSTLTLPFDLFPTGYFFLMLLQALILLVINLPESLRT